MSHISNISTDGLEFELDVIREQCKRQSWGIFQENSFAWYGKEKAGCDYVIRIPGVKYELGLQAAQNGKYHVVGDFWKHGGLSQVLGEQGEVFRQLYLQTSDIMWAEEKNFGWEEVPVAEDGTRKLVVYVNEFEGGGEW